MRLFLLVLNLALIAFSLLLFKRKLSNSSNRLLLKHTGLLEAGWTGFLFMLGLFLFFDIMEAATQDNMPFLEMVSQERMISLSALIGFGIIHLSMVIAIVIKLLKKPSF